jgi:MtrB/PioB family decaheme-associated outer membrane protein
MNTNYCHTPLAAAVLIALATPLAAQEMLEIDDLVNPRSTVRVGVGYIDHDNRWFGRYHGLIDTTENGLVPILGLDYVSRDNDTGTWTRANIDLVNVATGRFEVSRQGDWGARLDLSQSEATNPLKFNTGLTGIGTDTQQVSGTALRDVDLEMERRDARIELTKQLPNDFDVRFSFRNHDKEGERQWGIQGFNFVTEPVDYRMRELEAVVGYTGESLQLAGGLYGTSFDNGDKFMDPDAGSHPELSLPLDNKSYQYFLSGGYTFSPSTRANFKVSQTTATQDETFYAVPDRSCATTAPPCVSGNDLDAEVETTLAYAAISTRPLDDLSFTANVRYEDRDDNTPEQFFLTPPASPTRPNTNVAHSRKTVNWNLEGAYRLPQGFSVVAGVARDDIERSRPDARSTLYADNTTDSYRLELRRGMSETLNGSLSYTYSDREAERLDRSGFDPEDWVAPVYLADRERDEYKLRLDWAVAAPLNLTFLYQYTDDEYDLGLASSGVQEGNTELVSLDASYRVNEDWTVTAWISRDKSQFEQLVGSPNGGGTFPRATSDIAYRGNSIGLGVRGLVAWQHPVGADLQYGKDKSNYRIDLADDLPEIEYRYLRAHLFGEYVLDENSGLRADYIYTNYDNNEWAWNDWIYADDTTVELEENEDIHFIGLSYYYKWR